MPASFYYDSSYSHGHHPTVGKTRRSSAADAPVTPIHPPTARVVSPQLVGCRPPQATPTRVHAAASTGTSRGVSAVRIRINRPRSRNARGTHGPIPKARPQARPGASQRPCSPTVKAHITRLVVEVGNHAQAWRDAATDAELAFRWWTSAADGERGKAAAVYRAAAEREDAAANEYRRAWEMCCAAAP